MGLISQRHSPVFGQRARGVSVLGALGAQVRGAYGAVNGRSVALVLVAPDYTLGDGGKRIVFCLEGAETFGASDDENLLLPCLSEHPRPFQTGCSLHSGVAPRVRAEQSSSLDPKLQSPLQR